MRKITLFILLLVAAVSYGNAKPKTSTPAINATNFPDAVFRAYVSKNFDTNRDGILSEGEILKVEDMSISNFGISSLCGIEFFVELTELYCSENNLITLDVSQNTALTYLECYNNQLTTLDVSKNTALTTLICAYNPFTTLDVSNNTALTELGCESNKLTTLDVSTNTALTYLSCRFNQLTTLDVSKNIALTTLNCSKNQLTTLNVSENTALTYLDCFTNQLTTLDVSQNTELAELWCNTNPNLMELKIKRGQIFRRGLNYSETKILSDNDITWVD